VAINGLIALTFFLGMLFPFLLTPEKSLAPASFPAEAAALGQLLGESADSISASFWQHDDEAAAGHQGGIHHGEQNCCLCQALANLLHALPPADSSGIIAARAAAAGRVPLHSGYWASAALRALDCPALRPPCLKTAPFSSGASGPNVSHSSNKVNS
jgi:hypothetical protein